MRSVGQAFLAFGLVAVILVGGHSVAAVVQPATADASTASTLVPSSDVVESSSDRTASVAAGARRPIASPDDPSGGAVPNSGDGDELAAEEPDSRAGVASAPAQQAGRQASAEMVLTQQFRRLPDEPGYVEVTYDYAIPDPVVTLRTAIPERGEITGGDGFTAVNESIFAWDGSTSDPTLTYRLSVNETGSRDHVAANGSLLFADVDEWSLFRRPGTSTSWDYQSHEEVHLNRRIETVGPGAAGEWLVYLGEVDVYTRATDEQDFRLAVPTAANVTERPDDVLDAMERTAADLAVGEPNETVFAVAAPTESVPWSVRGLSLEGTDFWVGADEGLDTTDNLWVHEYLHTVQDYQTTTATAWTREGFATYYAAYQAMQHRSVTFAEFADALSVSDEPPTNVTLSEPDTWATRTPYERGALVAGTIDRRVRQASDDNRTIAAVFAGMNDDTGRLNASEFYGVIERTGNGSLDRAIRTAVSTDRPVSMWNRTQHVRAFDGMPPRIFATIPRSERSPTYAVDGPYRNATLPGAETPAIVSGESLVVEAEVTNAGGSAGYYDVALAVDGEVVDTAEGEVPAGAVREVPLEHTFDRAGEYTISVGNDTSTVRVLRPGTASIVGVDVTPGVVQQYESATVGVTVRNSLAIPADRTVTLRRDNVDVASRSVYLEPNATETTEFDLSFPLNGTATVAVDGAGTLEVPVEARELPTRPGTTTPNATSSPGLEPSSAVGPALGAVTAVVVLLGTVLLVRFRG